MQIFFSRNVIFATTNYDSITYMFCRQHMSSARIGEIYNGFRLLCLLEVFFFHLIPLDALIFVTFSKL